MSTWNFFRQVLNLFSALLISKIFLEYPVFDFDTSKMTIVEEKEKIFLQLSALTNKVESSIQGNEDDEESLRSDLKNIKILRKVALDVMNSILYEEEDEGMKQSLRKEADEVVENAEQVMFAVEDILDIPLEWDDA